MYMQSKAVVPHGVHNFYLVLVLQRHVFLLQGFQMVRSNLRFTWHSIYLVFFCRGHYIAFLVRVLGLFLGSFDSKMIAIQTSVKNSSKTSKK